MSPSIVSVKVSVPVIEPASSAPVPVVLPEKVPASFAGLTVRLMTLVSWWPSSSVTVTVKASEPLKCWVGVYVHAPVLGSMDAVPLLASELLVKVREVSPSIVSVKVSVPVIEPASSAPMPEVLPEKVPASFAGLTVRLMTLVS